MEKKIWAVTAGEYSDYQILGIAESKDEAEAFVDKFNKLKLSWDEAIVEEFKKLPDLSRIECHIRYKRYLNGLRPEELTIYNDEIEKNTRELTEIYYDNYYGALEVNIYTIIDSKIAMDEEKFRKRALEASRDLLMQYFYYITMGFGRSVSELDFGGINI